MPSFSSTTMSHVNAPLERVFEALSDLSRHGEWAANDLKVEAVSEGAAAVGSEYKSSVRFMGKDVSGALRIKALEPPSRFVFTIDDNNGRFEQEYRLGPQDGGTRVAQRTTGELGMMNYVIFKLFGDKMIGRPAARKVHAALAASAEAEGSQESDVPESN